MHPPNPPPRAPIPGWVMGGRCALSSRCQCQHAKEMSTDVSMGASDCPDAFHSVLQSPKKLHHPASTTCTGHAALRAAPAWRAGHLRRHVRICVPCHTWQRDSRRVCAFNAPAAGCRRVAACPKGLARGVAWQNKIHAPGKGAVVLAVWHEHALRCCCVGVHSAQHKVCVKHAYVTQ